MTWTRMGDCETMNKLTTISLGWGVQSWTLAAMVALGELEPVDFAIHSDTTHERKHTYDFAERMTPWLEERGVKVVTVDDAGQARKVATYQTDIPAFTQYSGNKGQLRRQCTHRWKVLPLRRFISAELKKRGLKKTPGVIETWLGITLDEWQRAKDSDVKYITHRYPLLDMNMTRADCFTWLQQNNLPSPGKSACVFCPYQNIYKWQQMKREDGPDWKHALEVDEQIRQARPPYDLFVHPATIPLVDAVRIPEDQGLTQLDLLHDAECDSGYCFL